MSDVKSQSARYLALHSDHVVARIFWISTLTLLTAIGAQIEIPVKPVPYTLQTLFVLLAGGLLGARQGFLSMSAYLMLGLVGLPVFASGGFGPATLLGPTGGYLLAFPIAALVVGIMVEKKQHVVWTAAAMIMGLLVIFTAGTIQLATVTGMSLREAIAGGFLIFSWWDLLKLGAAIAIYRQLRTKAGSV
ncbi:MAG: biotin transporter BioY [Bacteroidia bacterium]|nr:MAG: biotin transporter BioY [Bacteroidia bacterium]